MQQHNSHNPKHRLAQLLAALLCACLVLPLPAAAVDYGEEEDEYQQIPYQGEEEEEQERDFSDDGDGQVIDTTQQEENAAQNAAAQQAEAQKQQQIEENQRELESLQNSLDKLKEEQKELESLINSAGNKKDQQEAIKASLDKDLNNVLAQMEVLDNKIKLLGANIQETELLIEDKKRDINDSILQLRERIRASYTSGYSNALSVVLGADSYYDSLVRGRVITAVSDKNQEIISQLERDREDLELQEESLRQQQKDLENDKADYELSKEALNKKIVSTNAEIENIAQLEQDYLNQLEESKKQSKEMEANIQSVYQAIKDLTSSSSTSTYEGGIMAWPLPGYSTISSSYGWRFNGQNFHTGIDITGSGCMGAPIVAGNDGKVVVANTGFTQGRGYGIYVILDHGGGVTTLYGHMSSLAVSEGQTVSRGQTIGYVGTTGWSTGAHLHFEVRQDGNHTNPTPYL